MKKRVAHLGSFGHLHKKMRNRSPYWNFWRVVFAGWLIRYPDKIFRFIGIPLGILLVVIYNSLKN